MHIFCQWEEVSRAYIAGQTYKIEGPHEYHFDDLRKLIGNFTSIELRCKVCAAIREVVLAGNHVDRPPCPTCAGRNPQHFEKEPTS